MMARSYSQETIFRMVPFDLMQSFLLKEVKTDLGIDWSLLRKSDVSPISAGIGGLSQGQQDHVEQLLRTLYDVSCQRGMEAFLEAAMVCGDTLFAKDWIDGNYYARSMWCFLNRPKVYQKTLLLYRVASAHWWRQRNDLPPMVSLIISPSKLRQLSVGMSRFLEKNEGRGKRCTTEHMKRKGKDYFLVHADDYPTEVLAHDPRGRLIPRLFRGTFPVAYELDMVKRTLQLDAEVPRQHKEELERLFVKEIMGYSIGAFAKPVHHLEHLKYDTMRWVTDARDSTTVKIMKLELASKANPRERITLDADPDLPPERIYQQMDETLKQSVDRYTVISAKLCFRFESVDGREAGQHTFELKAHSSSFHPHKVSEERAGIIERCLEKSGVKPINDPPRPLDQLAGKRPMSGVA